jgi:hypothetical protein
MVRGMETDGAQVLGHILPLLSVPPGGTADKTAVFIFQGDESPSTFGSTHT